MNSYNSIRRRALLLAGIFITVANASACPDCALINSGGVIEPQTVMSKLAFSASTLFFISIFFSLMSFLIWMMVKTCRDLNQERILNSPSEI